MSVNNQVVFCGNIARVETRNTASGKFETKASICVESYSQQKGKTSEFYRVVAWDRTAKVLAGCGKTDSSKARHVVLFGHLRNSSWEDKKTGEKRTMTEIIADDIYVVDAAATFVRYDADSSEALAPQAKKPTTYNDEPNAAEDDDIPF